MIAQLIVDANDVHGNGTAYDSMLQPGAIEAACVNCHDTTDPEFTAISFHGPQHGDVDCSLCHTQTVISCINCHMDAIIDERAKCRSGTILDWKFVMKWDKGGGREVYHPATMMTVKYNCDRDVDPAPPECATPEDPKKTVAVLAPYYAHTVTQEAIDNILDAPPAFGQDGCGYCHGAENCDAILAANPDNRLKLIEFNPDYESAKAALSNPNIQGLIPLDEGYQDRYAIDYVEYLGPANGCEQDVAIFEVGPDLWQTGADTSADKPHEDGRPLTAEEFAKFCQ